MKVYGIPSKWSVCCWLADVLTTALMKSKLEDAHEKMVNILKIIIEVTNKLRESGPSLFKEIIFDLLTRIIKKTRNLLKLNMCKKVSP